MTTEQAFIFRFTDALAHEEGWHDARRIQTVAQRLNNPVCLTHWKHADGTAYPEVNGYAEFPDPVSGWRAARAQVKINIVKRNLTWREFFGGRKGVYRGFRPGNEGQDPATYARRVMSRLQIEAPLDAPITASIQ